MNQKEDIKLHREVIDLPLLAKYKAEHAHLLKLLYGLKEDIQQGKIDEDFIGDCLRSLLHKYELDATRRGIRL